MEIVGMVNGLEDLEVALGILTCKNTQQRKQVCTFVPLSMLNFEVVNFIPYCVIQRLGVLASA